MSLPESETLVFCLPGQVMQEMGKKDPLDEEQSDNGG